MNRAPLPFAMAVLAVMTGMGGCNYDNEQDLYPMDYCDTASVRYSATIVPIIADNCALAGCHVAGGSGTGDFTTYTGLNSQVANGRLLPSIMQSSGAEAMPPSGKLPDCAIAQITIWVRQGAPPN